MRRFIRCNRSNSGRDGGGYVGAEKGFKVIKGVIQGSLSEVHKTY